MADAVAFGRQNHRGKLLRIAFTDGVSSKKIKEISKVESNEIDSALDRAVTFLRGGVQRPGMEQALRVIETWEQRLAASENEELVSIAENLADLRVQLLAAILF